MSKVITPIDGSPAYVEDDNGRRLGFPGYDGQGSVIDGLKGERMEVASISEEITLATGAATTDSSAYLLPANSEILGVVARVTTTIATCTNWALGDGTTAARFVAATTDLTKDTTKIGLDHRNPADTNAQGPVQASAAKLRVTTTGSQTTAGKIRVTVFYRQFTAPTS